MAKFIPIILPQPGEDLRTWARQLTSQLQSLTAQLSSVLANIEVTGGGGGTPTPGGTTTPVKTPGDVTILDVNGYYIDGLGRVIVDATGFHVYDLVGFQVINGPNVYINTEHLVENAVKTAQLANDAVTYEKFFPDLVPIKVVDTLPNPVGYTGPGVVWLSTDRKLYRHTGTAWTSAVPAVDITGQLTNAQLESIAAAKLTGQIVETQIANDSISTPKLAAGSVSTAKLAAGAVVADTIAANAVTAVKLAANAVEADKIAANAVTTSKLDANAVTTEKLDALAVTAGKLAAGSVVAGKLAANAIVANDGVIANASIANAQIIDLSADKITAGSIAAERMEANIVTALNGKFATLSALASSLGLVQILPGGALLTQGVTNYSTGTGVYVDATQLRIGNPAGARLQWTGSALEVYNSSNQLTIASGNVDWAGVINKTGFASISQITSSNVSTYIAGAAIGTAQIANAAIGNAQIGGDIYSSTWDWNNGWLLQRNGNLYCANAYVRGNVEASSLKANTAMVGTLHINGNAVTVPVTYTSTATVTLAFNAWTTIGSAYINPEGAVVFVHAFAQFSNSASSDSPMYLRVVSPSGQVITAANRPVTSTIDWGTGTSTRAGSVSLSGAFSETGTYTIQLHPGPFSGHTAHHRALLLIAGKR